MFILRLDFLVSFLFSLKRVDVEPHRLDRCVLVLELGLTVSSSSWDFKEEGVFGSREGGGGGKKERAGFNNHDKYTFLPGIYALTEEAPQKQSTQNKGAETNTPQQKSTNNFLPHIPLPSLSSHLISMVFDFNSSNFCSRSFVC